MAQSSGKDDFIAKLKEKNIDLVLRYTEEGRIYGATYIDHTTKTVLNGSRLGKDFSANSLEVWFNNPAEKPAIVTPDSTHTHNADTHQTHHNDNSQTQNGHSQSANSQASSQSNHQDQSGHAHSNGYDNDTNLFDGLGGLFSVGPGYDAQEEAFYHEMQRRKKKKRRGPKL